MIVDKIENWNNYFIGAVWQQVADYLSTLPVDAAEGDHPIQGTEIFGRVMSYDTVDSARATFEAHHDYIDIQSVLIGTEGIAWQTTDSLAIKTAYDAEKDVEFYLSPEISRARVDVYPGYFVALFPHDAHMPQLQVSGAPARVKKVVVKVHTSLYVRHMNAES